MPPLLRSSWKCYRLCLSNPNLGKSSPLPRFLHGNKRNYPNNNYNHISTMSTVRLVDGRKMACKVQQPTFEGHVDRFKGVTVQSDVEQCATEHFQDKLDESLKFWRENQNRGIWFKVHLDQADWVPILARRGFKFHHAREEFVMMYLWLPASEISNIPQYAHTMIGVGAVVVNDNMEILVVSEKYYQLPHWKLPGGYVEPGENLVDAAIREVWEETNIKTEFQSVLTLRHAHQGMFGCSDIYTVVSLKPLTFDIEKCDREIANSKWMKIEEYLQHPNVHELNRFFVEKYLEYSKKNIRVDWHHGIHQILNKAYTVYYVTAEDEESAGK